MDKLVNHFLRKMRAVVRREPRWISNPSSRIGDAGIQIALTQSIRVDDVVIVEGEFGWIEEITLTYVVVRVWDRRRVVLPITHFVEKPFQNWTRTSADLIGSVFVYVDYRTPVGAVRDELRRIVEASKHWDGDACAPT